MESARLARILAATLLLFLAVPSLAANRGVSLAPGDSVRTEIEPAGDADDYVVDGHAGGLLGLVLSPAKGSELIPEVAVLDPSGTPLDLSAVTKVKGAKTTVKKLLLPATGRFAIRVTGADGSTGGYLLKTKGKAPKGNKWKGVALGAGETRDFTFGAENDAVVKVSIRAKGGAGLTVASVFGPDGQELTGGVEAFVPKGSGMKARLYPADGFGEYGFRVAAGAADLALTVSVKVKHPKVARRKLELSAAEPGVTSVLPDAGEEGDLVTVSGESFDPGGPEVEFGDAAATEVTWLSATSLRARVPAGSGTVDVRVRNPDGQEDVLADGFTYAQVETYEIRGSVSGDATGGVTMTLSGDRSLLTVTDGAGDFVFTGVRDGSYTVTPNLTRHEFEPRSRDVVVAGADVAGVDFVATWKELSVDTSPPDEEIRLVFIHHSCGQNWLDAGNGNLGDTLGDNKYYVRDTYYGWDAPQNAGIGDLTDIGHWYLWFRDTTEQGNGVARRDNILTELYKTSAKNADYSDIYDPGGGNAIVMFKSCFPNSDVRDDNQTVPADLFGQSAGDTSHTLSNTKEVYRQILAYMKTRTDKMFVAVTAPPLVSSATSAGRAANARALNDWLVEGWLEEADWVARNVYVFDFYNVLTDAGNHHRVWGTEIEHDTSHGNDYAAYGQGGDSHPNATGNQKATDEFVPLLNVYYHRWQEYLGNE